MKIVEEAIIRARTFYRKELSIEALMRRLPWEALAGGQDTLTILPQPVRTDVVPSRLASDAAKPIGKSIYFDIRDFITFIRDYSTLSGIQRVQAEVIRNLIEGGVAEAKFVLLKRSGSLVSVLNNDSLMKIINQTTHADDRPAMRQLIQNCERQAEVRELGSGDTLFILGSFWNMDVAVTDYLALKSAGVQIGCYIYDLIPISYPQFCDKTLASEFYLAFSEMLAIADFFAFISEFTRRDVDQFQISHGMKPKPASVTPLAHQFKKAEVIDRKLEISEKIQFARDRKFVLFVSTIEGRKNHLFVCRVWKSLLETRSDLPLLVFVGRFGWQTEGLMAFLKENPDVAKFVHFVHDLSDVELAWLYNNCLFTSFTSLAEGWGLPIGESLSYGKPCIVTNVSSMPEVGGDFCDYVDPDDVSSATVIFSRMIFDDAYRNIRQNEIHRSFVPRTWSEVTSSLWDSIGRMRFLVDAQRPYQACISAGKIVRLADYIVGSPRDPAYPRHAYRLIANSDFGPIQLAAAWTKRQKCLVEWRCEATPGSLVTIYLLLALKRGSGGIRVALAAGARNQSGIDSRVRLVTTKLKEYSVRLEAEVDERQMIRLLFDLEANPNHPVSQIDSIGLMALGYARTGSVEDRLSILEDLCFRDI